MATDAISEKSGDDDDDKADALAKLTEDLDSQKFSDKSKEKPSQSDSENDREQDEFASLDDALKQDFNIFEVTSLKQRFSDVNRQPRKVTDLFPAPLQLLTKRTKRCKACKFTVFKPHINPCTNEPPRFNFPMISNIPKVTLYKVNKYSPGSQFIEVQLQFRNPNMGQALISFQHLTDQQILHAKDNFSGNPPFDFEMPQSDFKVDPSETFLDVNQSTTSSLVADSATSNIKALVATCEEDQKYVYKKSDNFVILTFRLMVHQGYECDKNDLVFGFQMTTNASRIREPFKITTPLIFNCGKSKLVDNSQSMRSSMVSNSSAQQQSAYKQP